jgi:alkylhydroperoxidase family enzyme
MLVVPDALQRLLEVQRAINKAGVPLRTLVLVHLRTSQINGRPIRIPTNKGEFEAAGETDFRLPLVANWREETCFLPAERAALDLAEATTYLAGDDPVPDAVWDEVAKYYTEQELGAIVMLIGLINLWNRVNISTKQEQLDWRVPPDAVPPMTTLLKPSPR